jgi:hypothetical protein
VVLRKEVKEFSRCCDLLLNGAAVDRPLSKEERFLIQAYIHRLDEKLLFRGMPTMWG